jgi:hypothetical protein
MGFGALLHMKFSEITGSMCAYVLHHFSMSEMQIKVYDKVIDVTVDSVQEVLGFPMGDVTFNNLHFLPPGDTSYHEWAAQYPNKGQIRLQEVRTQIGLSNTDDMNFKLNFICVLINSLIESSSTGKCNFFPLQYIQRETDISNINWCEYLLDCLVRTKRAFDPNSKTMFFHGPSAFLVVSIFIGVLLIHIEFLLY